MQKPHPADAISRLKDPKQNGLRFTGKSRSAENEMAKPGEYSTKNSCPPPKALSDPRVYSLKITRTASTKEPEPRLTAKATIKPLAKSRRSDRPRNAFSLDMAKDPDPSVTAVVMVRCLSRAVFYDVKSNDLDRGTHVDVFVEEVTGFPTNQLVESFFVKIFTSKDLSAECAVTTAAYIDQLNVVSGIKLNQTNWRRICFISVLEADKVLRDKLVWNEDYKDLIPDIDLFELRKLERAFLKYIEFNLTLSQSDYAKYYFDLLSLRGSTERLSQLDREEEGLSLASPRTAKDTKKSDG